MRKLPRRILYILLALFWLAFMSLPFLAVMLAARGQVQLGDDDGRHVRIFLIQERTAAGIGIENARPLRRADACTRTTVTYLMWEGEGDNASYCQCFDPDTGASLPVNPDICPP